MQFVVYSINLNLVKLQALALFRYCVCCDHSRWVDRTADSIVAVVRLWRLYCGDFCLVCSISSCHATINWPTVESMNPYSPVLLGLLASSRDLARAWFPYLLRLLLCATQFCSRRRFLFFRNFYY